MKIISSIICISLAILLGIILGIKLQENSLNTTDFKKIITTKPKDITKAKKQQPTDITNISNITPKNLENKKTKISKIGTKTDAFISNIFLKFVKVLE